MAISNFAFLELPGILKNIFDPQLVKPADAKNCGYGGQAILLNMLYLSCYFWENLDWDKNILEWPKSLYMLAIPITCIYLNHIRDLVWFRYALFFLLLNL